jgi:hypothetical protein
MVLCGRSAGWSPRPALAPWLVPTGAMVAVFSPFLDDAVAQVAVHAARRGNLVVAVDVLPQPLRPDDETPWGEAVLALIKAERRARLDALTAHGIPVLHWPSDGSGVAAAVLLRMLTTRHHRRLAAAR